jgi:hypothetical protein
MKITLGKYKHYKGHEYEVIANAKHSETLEDMVVYRRVGDPTDVWVRPSKMFEEVVEVGGKKVPRFEFISASC